MMKRGKKRGELDKKMRTLNDNLKEDRREAYKAMLEIGFENDTKRGSRDYLVFKMLYDIFCWILEKKYQKT